MDVTERMWNFVGINSDPANENALAQVSESGVRLHFISGYRHKERIEMTIVVDEDTTIDAIRRAWPLVLKWRTRLEEYQGAFWPLTGDRAFYEYLWELTRAPNNKASYGQVAGGFNARISKHLRDFVAQQKRYEAEGPKAMLEYYERGDTERVLPEPMARALELMRLAGVQEADRKAWASDALDNLRADKDKEPFPPDCPVTRDMVRGLVRRWAEKRQGAIETLMGVAEIG